MTDKAKASEHDLREGSKPVTHGSLFDGFGGLRRGFEDAGFITKWTVDIINGQDITKCNPADFERVDLVSGGPVCQKTSRAARWQKQKTNESLFAHLLRFVSYLRPGWVVVEQPASVDRVLILEWIMQLERCGYGAAARIIDSQHWVPQRRARWIIVCRMGRTGLALWDDLYPDSERMERKNLQRSTRSRFTGNCPDCMPGGIFARISARKFALMGAGNAVTQPVARYIAERIKEVTP